ncbi:MAG TPA: hypothetical protein VF668_07395, partial [Pyrinomonadaceae bacterium]
MLPTRRLGRTFLLALALTTVAGLLAAPMMLSRRAPEAPAAAANVAAATPDAAERALETYGRVPLSFEANRGQAGGGVDFLV